MKKIFVFVFMISALGSFLLSCSKKDGFAPGSSLLTTISGSLQFTSATGGDFGAGSAGSIVEKTIEISPLDATTTLTNVTSTVTLPFKYKGGAYPGVGGTCKATISAACTIVLNFEPSSAGSFASALNFSYKVSGTSLTSQLTVNGSATLPPPTDLAIFGSNSIQTNQCVPYTVNTVITGNINSAVAADTTVTLAVNSGTGTFYSDVVCSVSTTTTVVANGQSTKTVYFKSATAPQTPTLVATSATYGSGTKVITVASSPTKLLVSSPAQSVVNDCRLVTISRLDTNNLEVASLSTTNINLSQNGSMQFFSDSGCATSIATTSIQSGTSNQMIYVMDPNVQSVLVTATDVAGSLTPSSKTINFVSTLQWWNTSFTQRVQITVDNKDQATTFTNQAVLVRLDSSIVAYSNINSDGSDIRFIAADHTTVYSHEIEKWDVNGYSYVWVKIPSVTASSEITLFMYFGNPSATSAEDASGTWSRYNSVWHLKEDPAGPAPQFADLGNAHRNGTASNSPTTTTGIIGNALNLTGVQDSFDVGNLAPVLGVTATLSFWINTSMVGNDTNYIAPGITGIEESGGVNDIFWGWIDASGFIAVTAGNGTGAKSLLRINDNVWRHIAISRNSANGAVAFYVNGVLNNVGTSGSGAITLAFSKFGLIPQSNGSLPREFNGRLDEIRIENTVLNSEQIKADFKFQNNSQLSFGQVEIY
jgi:hypothetical protein